MLRRAGFAEPLDRMAGHLAKGDIKGVGAMIPEDMASSLAMYGSRDRCRATLDALGEAGLQLAVLHPQFSEGTDPHTAISELIDAFAN